MKKLVIAVLVLFMASSCRPLNLLAVQPAGPPEYRLGWEDGCDTGVSSVSGIFAKAVYGHRKRPEMSQSEFYNQGWSEGFHYCRFSVTETRNNPEWWGM